MPAYPDVISHLPIRVAESPDLATVMAVVWVRGNTNGMTAVIPSPARPTDTATDVEITPEETV
jgi:hypothetical protein